MNRIVKEHYPVEKLSEDLREGFESGSLVPVTLIIEDKAADEVLLADLDAKLDQARADVEAGRGLSVDEVKRNLKAHIARSVAGTA